MEKIIKEMVTMKSSSANMARLSVAAVAVSGLVALGCMVFALRFIGSEMSNIYVLDRGNAMSATMASDDSFQRSLEVEDHVTRFHELLLNLSPSSDAIKSNIDRALLMSDRSAFNYWSDLSEQGFYQRLVSANISQQFALDSVKVDMKTYPYGATTYGKLYLIRESNITAYDMVTSCRLVDVGRSKDNPHGLMLEQFRVESNEKLGTRKRN